MNRFPDLFFNSKMSFFRNKPQVQPLLLFPSELETFVVDLNLYAPAEIKYQAAKNYTLVICWIRLYPGEVRLQTKSNPREVRLKAFLRFLVIANI